MSSSGECELDSETTPAVHTPSSSVAPSSSSSVVKMPESSGCGSVGGAGVKKTVYTRKKSTSAMQRKISAEFSHHKNSSADELKAKPSKDNDQDEESDSGPGLAKTTATTAAAAVTNSSSGDKYLSPRGAHHHPHAKHSSHRHHHHHQSASNSLRKHVLVRRSPSPSATMSPGYEQYQMALLEVPLPRDYGEASSDDLSSEWDSDAPDSRSRFLGNFKVIRCGLWVEVSSRCV